MVDFIDFLQCWDTALTVSEYPKRLRNIHANEPRIALAIGDANGAELGIAEQEEWILLAYSSEDTSVPLWHEKKISDVAVLDSVAAHVELIKRHDVLREIVSHLVVNAELPFDGSR